MNDPKIISLPLDSIILNFFGGQKNLDKKDYSLDEIFKKEIENSEKLKEARIKEELDLIPIYTYPIATKK